MRGQTKSTKSLTLSGKVYINHLQPEEIAQAAVGDVYLHLNDENELYPIILEDYKIKGFKGYFKAKVFDGKIWCILHLPDFFDDRINQFTKSEVSFYTVLACQERLEGFANTIVYRTYREHYSTYIHEQNEYKGRKKNKS